MKFLPYDNFEQKHFILRDWLALDRTVLATERTFLAYGRTSLALLATGLTMIKIFEEFAFQAAGYVIITAAVATFIFGRIRFIKVMNHFKTVSHLEEETEVEKPVLFKETQIQQAGQH